MLILRMLPARQGDCLWIDYGPPKAPHHLVVDGGPEHSDVLLAEVRRRLAASPTGKLHIDLMVVTHIDNDHIGGVLRLIENWPEGLSLGDLWFNGYRQVLTAQADLLGTAQADRLSALLERSALPWNRAFGGKAVTIAPKGELPAFEREDGLRLTLLGPDPPSLKRLKKEWKTAKSGEPAPNEADSRPDDILGRKDSWPPDISKLASSPFETDTGAPNGSSIALLLDYKKKRILLGADAFAGQLLAALDRLVPAEERVRLDACKLSHHGSKKSTSKELLRRLNCKRWLISTDGSYFGHPDAQALAQVIVNGGSNPELVFNSRSNYALRWSERRLQRAAAFRTTYPKTEGDCVIVELT